MIIILWLYLRIFGSIGGSYIDFKIFVDLFGCFYVWQSYSYIWFPIVSYSMDHMFEGVFLVVINCYFAVHAEYNQPPTPHSTSPDNCIYHHLLLTSTPTSCQYLLLISPTDSTLYRKVTHHHLLPASPAGYWGHSPLLHRKSCHCFLISFLPWLLC